MQTISGIGHCLVIENVACNEQPCRRLRSDPEAMPKYLDTSSKIKNLAIAE